MRNIFYTRPNHRCPFKGSSKDEEFAKFIKGESPPGVPRNLSFDLVVNGDLRYPCRHKDFMNYLRFVEHSCENLKFYLWLRDYIRRFEELNDEEKAMSPPWQEVDTVVRARPSIVEMSPEAPRNAKVGTVVEEEVDEIDVDADCLNQPFRQEVRRICELFLQSGSSLELNLSSRERNRTLRALRHTTHPSAFKPALHEAEYTLRWQSHPAFLRRQLGNANPARKLFLKIEGWTLLLLIGPVMAILLILSDRSRVWRIFPAIVIGGAAIVLLGIRRRMCPALTFLDQVQLNPWDNPEDFGVSMEEGATFNKTHKRNNSDKSVSSTASNLELRRQISCHTKSASASSAAIIYEESKDDIEDTPVNSRGSSTTDVSLEDDTEDITKCKAQMETFRRRAWITKAFTRGVGGVDQEIRRTQVHMVYQQAVLGFSVFGIMLVVMLPLPEYGII